MSESEHRGPQAVRLVLFPQFRDELTIKAQYTELTYTRGYPSVGAADAIQFWMEGEWTDGWVRRGALYQAAQSFYQEY